MDITTEVITSFRTRYPVFSGVSAWPDPVITIALCDGSNETGGRRWGTYDDDCHSIKRNGMFLYAAHWLSVSYPQTASDTKNQSSVARNPVTSKSVGDESISYASPGNLINNNTGDAWLASTGYGQQFINLRRRVGMGALAV